MPRASAAYFVFATSWFISTAIAAHLARLLQDGGTTLAAAVAIGALVCPAQVAARPPEFGLLRYVHRLLSARLAAWMHPASALLLMLLGGPVATVFAVVRGADNGIVTIAKGRLPLVLFGPQRYGHRQCLLMVPAGVAQALSPCLFGICLRWGSRRQWLSAVLGLTAFVALTAIPSPSDAAEPTSTLAANPTI